MVTLFPLPLPSSQDRPSQMTLGFLFWWLNLQVWPLTGHPGRVLMGPCTPHPPRAMLTHVFRRNATYCPQPPAQLRGSANGRGRPCPAAPAASALSREEGREDAKRATVSTLCTGFRALTIF